jgi:hypothetical protein
MILRNYYYDEDDGILSVEFSTKNDGDDFYRFIKIDVESIQYYSPTIISKNELNDIDEDFIIELLNEYFKDNDLPEQLIL